MKSYVVLRYIQTFDTQKIEVLGVFMDRQKGVEYRNKMRKEKKGKILFYETTLWQ